MIEIGIVEHNGNRFVANGTACDGTHLACYITETANGVYTVKRWDGHELMTLRGFVYGTWWDEAWGEAYTLVLRAGNGRYIGGLWLGDGALFRGEVYADCAGDDYEAKYRALQIAEYFHNLDCEDHARMEYEDSLSDEDE